MPNEFLDLEGLQKFKENISAVATQNKDGFMSKEDKDKLDKIDIEKIDGIASGAEVNQNTFSNIKVGSTTITADSETDTLTLAGSNVTLTPDATNDKVTIGITKDNVTTALGYTPVNSIATTSANGLMSKEDKDKLDNEVANRDEIIADNIIPLPFNEMSKTQANVTWSVDDEGVVKGSGTANADSGIYIATNFFLKAGTYTLSGCPKGGSANTYRVQLANSDYSLNFNDFGDSITFTITQDTVFAYFRVLVKSGVNTSTLIFKPILEKGIVAHPYQPYNLSRQKLRDDIDATNNSVYATCSTVAATAAKVITVLGDSRWELKPGATITVKFTETNTAQNPTFNVNGTGAKSVWYNTAVITTGNLGYAGTANRPMNFIYDGTQYVFMGWSIDNNSDTKATQTNTTTSAEYRVLLSTNANDTTETNAIRKSTNFRANPSTGAFYAKGYNRIEIGEEELDLDTLTLSEGTPDIMRYKCRLAGWANKITNIPVAGQPFILDVESIRWASATDYVTKQTFVSIGAKHNEYVRYCTSGTWETAWTKRLFTDNNTTYNPATTSANGLMSKEDKAKVNMTNIAYGTCSTAAATAEKAITITGNDNWTLEKGAIIVVKFTNTNSASSCTLNVNNTGAKQVWYNNAVYTGNSNQVFGYANRHMTYIYDGTYWVWIGQGIDNNSTYSNATLGQGYGTCTTAEATTAKVVTLSSYTLTVGGVVAVKFTYAVPANATMNINSKGAKNIFYKGTKITASVIKAGDLATFIYDGTQYHLIATDSSGVTATGTASTAGLTKLYTGTGSNTDGTMTQSAITTALSGKLSSSSTVDNLTSTSTTLPLSANQGRVLNSSIASANTALTNRGEHGYSLIINQSAPYSSGQPTTYTTYSSRKISDYDFLVLTAGTASNEIRSSMIVPTAVFKASGTYTFKLNVPLGGSVYNYISIAYVSDTQISLSKSDSAQLMYANVWGFKMVDKTTV